MQERDTKIVDPNANCCKAFLPFTSTAAAQSHQPAAMSRESSLNWINLQHSTDLQRIFPSDNIREKKGIISVLPYKHSAVMQRPEGTTNTKFLAQRPQQAALASVCEVQQKART